jgi:Sec-independent protein translocase protein TatA
MAKGYKKFKDYLNEEDEYDDEYELYEEKKKKDLAIKNKRRQKYDKYENED